MVSGHITDYSGFRYALFFLAEYINMITVSAVITTLFLGGYGAPWPLNGTVVDQGWWGLVWFMLKVQVLLFVFSWVRASVPRVRYDQLMDLGWKVLIPANLLWITMLALGRGSAIHGWWASPFFIGTAAVLLLVVLGAIWFSGKEEPAEPDDLAFVDEHGDFDAFAGGYPVPPMPGQKLVTTVFPSTADDEREPVGAASPRRATANTNGADA